MSTSMKLDVLTPVGAIYQGVSVPGVEVPGLLGELGVLPDHESFITAIKPGVLRFRDGAKSVRLAVGSGFIEVKDDGRVVILCERALTGEQVDKPAAKERLAEVERELQAHGGAIADAGYRALLAEREWCNAQLAV